MEDMLSRLSKSTGISGRNGYRRPLGCRVFFCQQGTEDWQHELYERFLARLKALHEQYDVAYRYLEWRAALAEAAAAGV